MIKKLITQRLNAGALYLVLAFSLVIAITLSMILLLRYYYSFLDVQNDVTMKLQRNLESGWEYVKANENEWTSQYITIDLFGRASDTLVIHSKPWGIYHAVALEARSGKRSERQSALLGKQSPESHRYAIHLRNRANGQLKAMENTVIKGDLKVPSSMVIPTFYNGKPFQSDKVVDGRVYEADNALPAIDEHWLKYIKNLLQNNTGDEGNTESHDLAGTNSFFEPARLITSEEPIELNSVLKNNIIVYSTTAISVTSTASLNGVLLVAPAIRLSDSVKGCFQAIASKQIIVANGVRLEYPSALVVFDDDAAGAISIGNSMIQGSVIMLTGKNLVQPELKIQEGAHIVGEIFTQGTVQFYGKLTGSIVCDRFVFVKGGEVRDNALWNVTIDGTRLPKPFVFSQIYAERSSTNIACWL